MAITVEMLRTQLGAADPSLIADDMLQQQIDSAQDFVWERKLGGATSAAIDNAVLYLATYNAATTYYDILNRTLGRTPDLASAKLAWLWKQFLFYAEPVLGRAHMPPTIGTTTHLFVDPSTI